MNKDLIEFYQEEQRRIEKNIIETAKSIVINNLSHGDPISQAYLEIFKVNSDKKHLLAHLKAINCIFNKAIEILEREK